MCEIGFSALKPMSWELSLSLNNFAKLKCKFSELLSSGGHDFVVMQSGLLHVLITVLKA